MNQFPECLWRVQLWLRTWDIVGQVGFLNNKSNLKKIFLLFSYSVVSDSLQPHPIDWLPSPLPSPRVCSNSCHWVSNAIQPSHPLSPSPPALNLSQHQSLFQWVGSLHQVAGVLGYSRSGVHWDDTEGWYGEGVRRGVQDREHMYTRGGFMLIYGKTNTIL